MEIHQLRYFCAVARTGSFTRAAAEEGIAQPSLSQQIVKLEKDLDARLFDRLGRGVQLTEYGASLLPQAQQILRHLNEARSEIESLRRGVSGHLAIGCIPTITPYFLAPRLSEFAQQYRNVELRLVEEITPKLVQLLQAGKLDVAIMALPVANPDVICSELFREPIVVAVGREHRLAGEARISLPELRGEKMLLLKDGHCFRNSALTVCSRGRIPFYSMFETDQFSSIFPLVAAGFGISLVPKMAVNEHAGCVFLPLEREAFRRVGYMRVRRHASGPAQKAFVQWIRTVRPGVPQPGDYKTGAAPAAPAMDFCPESE